MPHTTDFQAEKALVRAFYADLDEADKNDVVTVLERYLSDDCLWRGMHPFHVQEGPKAVADSFWNPFKAALPRIQRRQDIFLAGRNSLGTDDSVWVVSMGHLAGLFDQPWLSIPSTRKLTFLPYCEFNKVFRGKIVETAMFCDIISVMIQAGLTPLPTQTGAFLLQPGPQTHDGLMFDRQPREAGEKTLALINSMIGDLTRENVYSPIDELRRSWKEDMNWFGPAGSELRSRLSAMRTNISVPSATVSPIWSLTATYVASLREPSEGSSVGPICR